eukprot:4875841-Prymnesium_polylepis.1
MSVAAAAPGAQAASTTSAAGPCGRRPWLCGGLLWMRCERRKGRSLHNPLKHASHLRRAGRLGAPSGQVGTYHLVGGETQAMRKQIGRGKGDP